MLPARLTAGRTGILARTTNQLQLKMTTPNKKDALGKGIRSLLQNIDADLKSTEGNLKSDVTQKSTSMRIPLSEIEANPKQPRHDFDETALKELAASIKTHDIIQPLTVS